MVQIRQTRSDATDRVGDYANIDEEFEYHQALVADVQFGTIALCLRQLEIGDYRDDVQRRTDQAADRLQWALDARAEQVREEIDDE